MAVLQINSPLGLTLLYNFGAPEAAFSHLPQAAGFLICTGILQWLALALGGSLLTWPLAHLGTFVVLSIITSYLIYASPHLGRLWVWAQVPVLTSFYLMVLQPGTLAADNAEAFSGLAIAAGLLWLGNRLLWPCPPGLTLRESTSAMMMETRTRLHRLIAASEDHSWLEGSASPMAPRLGYHLTLLNAAMKQAPTLEEAAELLSRAITAERVRHEIGQLENAVAARGERDFPAAIVVELSELDGIFGRLLQEHPASAMTSQPSQDESYLDVTAALAERIRGLARAYPSMTAMLQPLSSLAQILANDDSERPPLEMRWPSIRLAPNPVVKRFILRFSLRHTLALTIAFLIGLSDNSPALHAAIWLLMLGGPPSHGATARKFTVVRSDRARPYR